MRDVATKKEWLESLRNGVTDWHLFHPDPVTLTPRWALALLAIAFGVVLAMLPIYGNAETVIPTYVVEQESVRVRMLPTPCADAVSLAMILQMAPPQYQSGWKAISSDWKHKDGSWHEYAGCWYELKQGDDTMLFFMFSDGTFGQALKSEILKPKGRGA